MWQQCLLTLKPRSRGFHLVTDELVAKLPMLADYRVGMAHLLLQHTSASLTLNENCDPSVRSDMEAHLHRLAPEDAPYYRHTYEGPDDMPAHIKSSLLGVSLQLPIRDGQLALGTWQGIWLGEHRVDGGARKVLVTLQGE
ncbi:secondary thiamine-phosphate synthase enzyme YjbQ [Aeromonas veronii]|uniref:secondary thiamine-phosphate synthase enzyme YjbQ n=1 Tax=Aeromonas TaxID=642 RepID=UPI00107A10D3|nr:secondary thiamine-phosphate synthase enzyme YjbQ [Aeromonas veronii]KAE9628691.1 YjbQ family protein [Aeromonas veronii]QLH68098.1 YjbQ family protein [Aeromonas veronii]HDX8363621.1 YjbQ family protein [Aeromonas veronii]